MNNTTRHEIQNNLIKLSFNRNKQNWKNWIYGPIILNITLPDNTYNNSNSSSNSTTEKHIFLNLTAGDKKYVIEYSANFDDKFLFCVENNNKYITFSKCDKDTIVYNEGNKEINVDGESKALNKSIFGQYEVTISINNAFEVQQIIINQQLTLHTWLKITILLLIFSLLFYLLQT